MRITIEKYHVDTDMLSYRVQKAVKGALSGTMSWGAGVVVSDTADRIHEALHLLETAKYEEFNTLPASFRALVLLIQNLEGQLPGCGWADLEGARGETSPDGSGQRVTLPPKGAEAVEVIAASTAPVAPPTVQSSPQTGGVLFHELICGRLYSIVQEEFDGEPWPGASLFTCYVSDPEMASHGNHIDCAGTGSYLEAVLVTKRWISDYLDEVLTSLHQ